MRLPDGTVLMDGDIMHRAPYDPAKARAYYLRTRKLKGRAKAAAKPATSAQDQTKYKAALDKFFANLPMAIEGASRAETEKFVDDMRKKSDAELKAEQAKIKKEKGDNDGAKVATIEALLKNRERVRKQKKDKPAAKKPAAKKTSGKPAAARNAALKGNKPSLAGGLLSRTAK